MILISFTKLRVIIKMIITKFFLQLKPQLRKYSKNIAITVVAVIIISLSILCLGKIVQKFIDLAISNKNVTAINIYAMYALLCVLIFSAASYIRSYNLGIVNESITSSLRGEIYRNLMSKNITFFETNKITDILDNINSGMKILEQFITNIFSYLLRNILLSLISIVMMFYQNTKLASCFFLLITLLLIPISILRKILKNYNITFQNLANKLFSRMEESFTNYKLVKAFRQNNRLIDEFNLISQEFISISSLKHRYRSIFFTVIIAGSLNLMIAIIWLGGMEVISKQLAPGALISFIFYALIMSTSIIGLLEPLSNLFIQNVELDKLFALIHYEENPISKSNKMIERFDINIENLNLTLGQENKILQDINLNIPEGSFVVIIGPSGSGKSSLVKTILGFYPTEQNGIVNIGNISVNDIGDEVMPKIIAYVPQDPMLFSISLRKNITFANTDITDDKLDEILKITFVDEILVNLPDKLDTVLNNKADFLSGGQKQRISIARALASNSRIIIFDEATSAMNLAMEQKILDNIKIYTKGKTVIYIAHRIKSIKDADNIIVLDKGRVLAQGSHEILLKSCELYANNI